MCDRPAPHRQLEAAGSGRLVAVWQRALATLTHGHLPPAGGSSRLHTMRATAQGQPTRIPTMWEPVVRSAPCHRGNQAGSRDPRASNWLRRCSTGEAALRQYGARAQTGRLPPQLLLVTLARCSKRTDKHNHHDLSRPITRPSGKGGWCALGLVGASGQDANVVMVLAARHHALGREVFDASTIQAVPRLANPSVSAQCDCGVAGGIHPLQPLPTGLRTRWGHWSLGHPSARLQDGGTRAVDERGDSQPAQPQRRAGLGWAGSSQGLCLALVSLIPPRLDLC